MTIALILAGVVLATLGTVAGMLVGFRVRAQEYDGTAIYIGVWFIATICALALFYIAGTMAVAQ